jgi:RNase H-like domain found in reverse transcriptase/Reverse transcriptase (RNA-dependent DNA polymerase)
VVVSPHTLAPGLQGTDDNGTPRVELARNLLHKCREAFAADPKNPRVTDRMKFDIDTGRNPPVTAPARRWSSKESDYIDEQVLLMYKRHQVLPSQSPWATNPVLVHQGPKLRFCLDYRGVNLITRKDSLGLGNIDDLLLQLNGANILSTLDLAAGYYQKPLTDSAAPKTAFRVTSDRLWQFRVSPFGLVNLPAAFKRLMHSVLGSTIMVYSATFEQHLQDLEEVLTKLIDAKLSCSLAKSHLFREEVKFLGHTVGKDGIWPCTDKVKAMLDMRPPLKDGKPDLKLIQRFEGIFNYYRRYTPHYSHIMAPITKLTRNTEEMVWTSKQQEAFEEVKRVLASDVVLAHPDSNLPYVLQTDASKTAIGAVLTQFKPTGTISTLQGEHTLTGQFTVQEGREYREAVIGYYSKLNSVQDAKMAAVELECLAVAKALEYFRPYVWGKHITVLTDASACRGFVHTFALSSDCNAMCCVRCDGSRAYTCTCKNIWIVSVMSLRVNRLPLTCYPRSDVLLYITDCNTC